MPATPMPNPADLANFKARLGELAIAKRDAKAEGKSTANIDKEAATVRTKIEAEEAKLAAYKKRTT